MNVRPSAPAQHTDNRSENISIPHGIILWIREFFQTSQTSGFVALAALVGIGAGLGAVVFRYLINWAHSVFFGGARNWEGILGKFSVVLAPAAGGLIVGLLIYYFAREAKGHGVPEVMEAVAEKGGRIRPRVAVVKSLASAICIGSGGSAGREGPIVQIGSSIGSTLGQILRLGNERVRVLVACGAAGGIAATFNAPIAGAIFALEVILRTFASRSFGAVVLASVAALMVSRPFLGDTPAFNTPEYSLVSAWELALYVVLGILAALVAKAYMHILYATEDLFDKIHLWEPVKPVIGGALVGLAGVWLPQIFGVGYPTIEAALSGKAVLAIMALLVAGKILATSVTIGSGGSGGVFAPSLFIGAALGFVFGDIANAAFPSITAGPGAYALVGMGAVFTGAARAPMTSVLIIFEMTGDYRVILPLMTAIVISTLVSEHLGKADIYTMKLLRRGIDISKSSAIDRLDNILVSRAMTRDVETVDVDMPVRALVQKFADAGTRGFPVVVGGDKLWGVVTLTDIEGLSEADIDKLKVRDVASSPALTCRPDQSLGEAIKQFGAANIGRLPVVHRSDPDRLIGMLRRSDIIEAYAADLPKAEKKRRSASLSLDVEAPGVNALALTVSEHSPWPGRPVHDLGISKDALIVSIERGGKALLPKGDTVLEAGDKLTVVAESDVCLKIREEWEAWAKENLPEDPT